jgi:phage repressor protein C with HTH and peptisase S24 domain
METKNDISERFIKVYLDLVETDTVEGKRDFATKLGISPSMVTEISKGRSSVGLSAVQNIVSIYNVNPDWILTGKGDMYSNSSSVISSPSTPIDERSTEPASHVSEGSQEGIPLLPISAMAGAFTDDISVMEYECERYVIPAFKGADFLMQVSGDSMQPTYYSGDLVACQRIPLNDLFFQWNKTYVLDTLQGPLIKRIRRGSDEQHVLIVSDNPAYEPFELSKDQFHGVALVRGLVRIV